MKISILSGKGGTGKTTVATNLAKILKYRYVDCDVEEPNGFIFLKPQAIEAKDVEALVPVINYDRCVLCGKCVEACQFNALANTGKEIMIFEKLCHGCGACTLICPEEAIKEEGRVIGRIDIGNANDIECIRGILNIGEPMSGPIISKLKRMIDDNNTIIDCSPGSSCNVVKAIQDSDFAVLVTEATEFGLHDLKIAVGLAIKMGIPFGVIINRADEYTYLIERYCNENNISILGSIPFDRKAAELYSEGNLLINNERYEKIFSEIAQNIEEVVLCS